MEIPLSHLGNIFPGGAAEDGAHIVRRSIRPAVPPDIIVVVGVIPGFPRLPEPAVLVGAVVQGQIHQDADAPLFSFRNQLLHVRHSAEQRVNGAEIGNVVAVVHLGGGADGAQPDRVDTQRFQIIQPGQDAPQISHAAAGGILEALGVKLIEHGGFPPAAFGFVKNYVRHRFLLYAQFFL